MRALIRVGSGKEFFFIVLGLWLILFCGLRTAQHLSFGTNACDLSLFDYGMYYTLRGEWMEEPFHQYGVGHFVRRNGDLSFEPLKTRGWESHFAIHFTPIVFVIVPLYLVFDGPLFLLWLQVLFVGASAVPLFLIARHVLVRKELATLIAVVYLIFRHLLIGLMRDFDVGCFFPLLFFSSYYFLAVDRKPLMYFTLLSLALFIREDIAVYILFFGLFVFFRLKERRLGALTAIVSLVYFLAVLEVIIPFFRSREGAPGAYVYDHIWGAHGGLSAWTYALQESLDEALFLRKFGDMVLPLLLLPFLSSYGLLILPPVVAAIATRNPQVYTFGIHYGAMVLPFVFLASVQGLRNVEHLFERINRERLRLAFLGLLLLVNLVNSNIWRLSVPLQYRAVTDYRQVKLLIDGIPQDASVAAQSALIPHIPKRKNIYMLPERDRADWILVHSGVNLWPYKEDEFRGFLERIDSDGAYASVYSSGGIQLFKKRYGPGR